MTKLMIGLAATAVVAGGVAALPTRAEAQQSQAEIVVYGNDPCPRSTGDQVVVCSRRPEGDRYRLPKNQQLQGSRQQRQAWANKAQSVMSAGATGINSCSPVGPGGHTGCLEQQIQQAKREAQEQNQENTAPPQ